MLQEGTIVKEVVGGRGVVVHQVLKTFMFCDSEGGKPAVDSINAWPLIEFQLCLSK